MVQHLQVDILDVLDGLEKAFVLGDCPYCNIRRVGPGQDDLRVRELSEGGCAEGKESQTLKEGRISCTMQEKCV